MGPGRTGSTFTGFRSTAEQPHPSTANSTDVEDAFFFSLAPLPRVGEDPLRRPPTGGGLRDASAASIFPPDLRGRDGICLTRAKQRM